MLSSVLPCDGHRDRHLAGRHRDRVVTWREPADAIHAAVVRRPDSTLDEAPPPADDRAPQGRDLNSRERLSRFVDDGAGDCRRASTARSRGWPRRSPSASTIGSVGPPGRRIPNAPSMYPDFVAVRLCDPSRKVAKGESSVARRHHAARPRERDDGTADATARCRIEHLPDDDAGARRERRGSRGQLCGRECGQGQDRGDGTEGSPKTRHTLLLGLGPTGDR